MLGYKLTGNWAERGVTVVAYNDRYTFNILEQLLFRLATLGVKPTVYLLDKARKSTTFTKKELKGGGFVPSGDSLERETYFNSLVDRFPQVSFIRSREVDFVYTSFIKNSFNKRSIISLGIDLSKVYEQTVEQNMDESRTIEYLRNSGNTRKYVQLLYGINEAGNSEVELCFTQKNGVLTPRTLAEGQEYGEPVRIDHTHEIRMMVNLIVNDLLTERYINYTVMSMVDDEIVKTRLVVPTLTPLEQSYLYSVKDEQKQVLNALLTQLADAPEGYSSLKESEVDKLNTLLTDTVITVANLFNERDNGYMGTVFNKLIERIPLIEDSNLKGKWLQGAVLFQQKLTYDSIFETNTVQE